MMGENSMYMMYSTMWKTLRPYKEYLGFAGFVFSDYFNSLG